MKRICTIFSIFLVFTSLLTTTASAATEVHPGSYLKEPSFVAIRSGKDVVMQWMKKPNDESYRLIVGHLTYPKDPLASKLTGKYTERIDLRNKAGVVVYSIYYNTRTQLSNLSAQGKWIYSKTLTEVRDEDFVSLLITKSGTTQTYSLSLFDEGISSTSWSGFKQRTLKIACYVSSWGAPISDGFLSASNLSLSAFSTLPGAPGKAAIAGSQIINKVTLWTNSTLLGAEEVVRGEINYQIDASKSDPSKLQPGNTIQIQLKNGQKRTATIKALSRVGKTTNLVLDVSVNINEARSLFETIKTAKSSAEATKEICRQLK
jgi:hypothetical protein